MKKNVLVSVCFCFLNSILFSQNTTEDFGIKGGLNLGKYSSKDSSAEYDFNLGFYAGGFYVVLIEKDFYFQPELLYVLQGSKVKQVVRTLDSAGNPFSGVAPYDFEYEVYESTISIPIMLKWYWLKDFYIESGPQLGFIINRKITSSQQLLDGSNNDLTIHDDDNFDFGVSLGFGYDISDKLTIHTRAFSGLIKRDDRIKPFVFHLGMEYRL